MFRHLSAVLLSLLCMSGYSQLFTTVVPDDAVGLSSSHNAWVDFDNDGDLDFLVTGAVDTNDLRTLLYENRGNGQFRQALSPFNILPQYSESEIAFLPLDGDERIDILLMGRRIGTVRTSLLRNTATGFVDTGPLPGFEEADGYGTISIGDVNNDAKPDVFLGGIVEFYEGSPIPRGSLFLAGNETYDLVPGFSPVGLYNAASQFADLDNDNDLDLIFCGRDNSTQHSYIYINDGTRFLTDSPVSLKGLQNPSIDVADFDGDHDLDILLTGLDDAFARNTILYRNDGMTFTEVTINAGLNRTVGGSAKWGDYDNDGDADILITGDDHHASMAILEQDNGQYAELQDASFDTLGSGELSWGDYDDDGDLDILATGAEVADEVVSRRLFILRNEVTPKNNPPASPEALTITPAGDNSYLLTWPAATDDLTDVSSLTYNLSIRDATTGAYLLHPLSDPASGRRRVAEHGNVWLNTGWKLHHIEDGIYAVKVQSIDAAFSASAWSDEKIVYAGVPSAPDNLTVAYDNFELILEWADNSVNEKYFMVEKKSDDGNFLKVDSVSGVSSWREPSSLGFSTYRVYAVNPNGFSATSNEVTILITGTEYTTTPQVALYPNPASDSFTLRLSTPVNMAVAILFDALGAAVHEQPVTFNARGEATLDAQALPAGLYWLELRMPRGYVERVRVMKR